VRTRTVLLVAFANLGSLFLGGSFVPANAECLAGPNRLSPPGTHWFYRLDRVDRRKCWYLGPLGKKAAASAEVAAGERRVARPRLRSPVNAAPSLPGLRQTEPEGSARAEEPAAQAGDTLLPTVTPDTLAQTSVLGSTPPDDEAQDEMPSVWPEPPPRESSQPSVATPSAPGISWIAMLALLAGALAAARFLPAAIIEFVGSRRFDALATRINTFFLDVRASLWRAIENLQHRSSLQAGAGGPYVSAPPLASLFQP